MKGSAPIGSAARVRMGRNPRTDFRRARRLARWATALALVLAAVPATSQEEAEGSELDRVLAAHFEARGGLERLRAVTAVRGTATMTVQGMEAPFTVLLRSPNQVRMDGDFGGMALIRAFDGEQAWAQQPGELKPTLLEGDLAAVSAADADINVQGLVDIRQRGYNVELAGREEIESGEAWKLLVTAPSGVVQQVFIGVEDGLERKRVAQVDLGFGLQESATLFDDFRDVDGLMIAHRHTMTSPMGEMPLQFESFEINPDLDPDVFFMPGQMADATLGLDEVLVRYGNARGGLAAEVESVSGIGTAVLLGFEVPMTMAFARPSSFRIDIDLQGLSMVLAYDGVTPWTLSPMQGVVEPTPLPQETAGAAELLGEFLWGLLASREERGLGVSFGGIGKVARDETYRLDIVTAEGEQRTLHLGGEDFLERSVVFGGSLLGSTGEIDVTLGDYMDAGGLKVPGTIRIAVEGQVAAELRIREAEANADIDPASFTMPAPADPETPDPAVQEP